MKHPSIEVSIMAKYVEISADQLNPGDRILLQPGRIVTIRSVRVERVGVKQEDLKKDPKLKKIAAVSNYNVTAWFVEGGMRMYVGNEKIQKVTGA